MGFLAFSSQNFLASNGSLALDWGGVPAEALTGGAATASGAPTLLLQPACNADPATSSAVAIDRAKRM